MKQLPQVLLVDDNPADVVLAREALAGGKHQSRISNVQDGEEALAFLHRIGQHADALRPDLVILDLNLPKKDGRAVLARCQSRQDSAHYPSRGVQYLALDAGYRAQLRARRQLLRSQAWQSRRLFCGGAID